MRDDPSALMKIHLAMGRALRDKVQMATIRAADPQGYIKVTEAHNKHRELWNQHRLRDELGLESLRVE
jgi:hypothetical protein